VDDYGIIIKPLVTEQGMHLANVRGAYSFQVDKRANKAQVRRAVERLYGVKVASVNTANRKGKVRRRGMNFGKTASWKKAVVYLKGDQHIDLF
jgi:large subunit ribosomal protein L23